MADPSPFDALEAAFRLLCDRCEPLALDGRDLGRPFPPRRIVLDELAAMLLHPSTPYAARDRAVRLLVERSRETGGDWTVGLGGVILPGMRRALAPLARAWPAHSDDLEADALTGLVEATSGFDPGREPVVGRLLWRVTSHARRRLAREMAAAGRHVPSVSSTEPHPPWGHPDFVLAHAARAAVISAEDAELIGETRLGGRSLHDYAAEHGEGDGRLRVRRFRAERRLVAWVHEKEAGNIASDATFPAGRPGRRIQGNGVSRARGAVGSGA